MTFPFLESLRIKHWINGYFQIAEVSGSFFDICHLLSVICWKWKNSTKISVVSAAYRKLNLIMQKVLINIMISMWTNSYPVTFAWRHFQQNWSWVNISGLPIRLNRSVTSARKSFPIKLISISISQCFVEVIALFPFKNIVFHLNFLEIQN